MEEASIRKIKADYKRARRKANPEKAAASQSAWRKAHPESGAASKKAWRKAHSEEHKASVAAWREANPEKVRGIARRRAARRRARIAGAAFVEDVELAVLGKRDGWICGICREPVDRSLRWPDRMSGSHDHVVALVNGGDHSYANAQLAHWICNVRKSARL